MRPRARPKISAILMAAGLSRRMGSDKLLLSYRGKTLLQRAVDLLDGLRVFEKILVTTPARLTTLALSPGILTVMNERPEAGQSESLRLGVTAATGETYLFLAADQPRLTPQTLRPLLDKAGDRPDKIINPTIGGNPSTPALFPARFRAELLALAGDAGGRSIRAAHPESCLALEAESPEDFMDIDDLEDYRSLQEEAQYERHGTE